MARHCDHMVFDSDDHLYETRDSLTRHLPDRYRGAIDYVDVRGRTKIAFRMMTAGKRPIEDTMAALVCHGVLTGFPQLRVAAVENGGDWVVPFLDHLEDTYRKMPHAFDEDPIAAFKRNIWVNPFHEDDIAELIEVLGADHILFGSDYPHPEGLAEPCSYVDHLPPGLSDDVVAGIMGGNLAEIMRVPVAV